MSHEKHKSNHRHHIGDHGDQIRGNPVALACNGAESGAESKEKAGKHGAVGAELAEDHSRDGDKALSYNDGRTELADGSQRYISAAQSGKETGKDHADVADPENVDAKGRAGFRVFSGCPQPHPESGFVKDEPHHKHGDEGQIGGEYVFSTLFQKDPTGNTPSRSLGSLLAVSMDGESEEPSNIALHRKMARPGARKLMAVPEMV